MRHVDLRDLAVIGGLVGGAVLLGVGIYMLAGLAPVLILAGLSVIALVLWPQAPRS